MLDFRFDKSGSHTGGVQEPRRFGPVLPSAFINSPRMDNQSASPLRTSVLLGRTGLGNLLVRSM
jgi:hypothetical protein